MDKAVPLRALNRGHERHEEVLTELADYVRRNWIGSHAATYTGSSQIAVDCWAAFDRRLTRAGISVKAGVEEGALGLAG